MARQTTLIEYFNEGYNSFYNYIIGKSRGKKAFQYPGGDWYVKDDILKVLSYAPCRKCILVEVFGGSGVITQHAPVSKYRNRVYNDLDRLIYNLVKTIKEQPRIMQEVLSFIPYSREIHDYIKSLLREGSCLEPLVNAILVFYLLNSSFNGKIKGSFSYSKDSSMSRAHIFMGNIASIMETAKRFRDVTIESLDFRDLIKRYDTETTVFYLDPPYYGSKYDGSTFYNVDFTPSDIRDLVEILNNIQGYYVLKLSDDQLEYYEGLQYKDKVEVEHYKIMEKTNGTLGKWIMVLLTNYKIQRPRKLF